MMRGSSRTFVWCMGLGGSAVLRARDRTASVFCVVLAVCEKIWTCVCAELGSTFELEHDLGCFEHVLTHSNRLVWFVLSETDVLQSRSDLPSPLFTWGALVCSGGTCSVFGVRCGGLQIGSVMRDCRLGR